MWIPGLLLLLAFTSVIADIEDDLRECEKNIDMEELESLMNRKSSEELGVVCPMVLNFFSCVEDALRKHTGMTLDDMARITKGTEIGRGAELVVNVRDLFQELCTEGTPLNKDYMEDIDCYDRIENPLDLCEARAIAAYETFHDFTENVEEEAGDKDFEADRRCIKYAYKSACIASIVHETCGQHAFETFNKIIKRSTIFKNAICSEEGLNNLKTTFLDSLDMEDTKKDLFRLAFDLRKRKK